MVTKSMELELFATTIRERILSNNRSLGVHGRGKESLSETTEPDFIKLSKRLCITIKIPFCD